MAEQEEWTPPQVGKLYKPNPEMFKHHGGLEFDIVNSQWEVIEAHACKLDDIFLCIGNEVKSKNKRLGKSRWPGCVFLVGDRLVFIDKSELDLVVKATAKQ